MPDRDDDEVTKRQKTEESHETVEQAIASAAEIFGAEAEVSPSAVWVSRPVGETQALAVQIGPTPGDISVELAHKFGCTNVYFSDIDMNNRYMAAKKSGDNYQGTQFVQLTVTPWLTQRFVESQLRGFHVLLPICKPGKCFFPPNGNIDEIDPEYPLTDKSKAKIKISVRPTAYNRFTQSDDGSKDMVSLSAFAWLHQVLEPRIKKAMDNGHDTSRAEWSSATHLKSDITSICLYSEDNVFRDPRPEEGEQLALLENKQFVGGHTELTNKICIRNFKLMNDKLRAYRVTTAAERDASPDSARWLEPLTWQQQSMINSEDDEIMLLVNVKALTKGSNYHPVWSLAGFIWFGPSSAYAGMKENTAAEKLRLVPAFPTPPSQDVLWKRREAQQERDDFQSKLKRLKDERNNA